MPSHALTARAGKRGRAHRRRRRFHAFLLHGVTGSGKTEVYLHLDRAGARARRAGAGAGAGDQPDAAARGALPAARFPDARSRCCTAALEDIAAHRRLARRRARRRAGIVLGTRLAVLAPLPQPRPDRGRRGARRLVQAAGRPALFGARCGGVPREARRLPGRARHRDAVARDLAQLARRALRAPRAARARRRQARGCRACAPSTCAPKPPDMASRARCSTAIGARLAQRRAEPVFINRRGYAPVLACEACGWTAGCERCTRAHGAARRQTGACAATTAAPQAAIPRACPTCGNVDLQAARPRHAARRGNAARRCFRRRASLRIDRDSARRRGELARTLEGIRRGEGDILVGTQLLAKGHDFPERSRWSAC